MYRNKHSHTLAPPASNTNIDIQRRNFFGGVIKRYVHNELTY